MRLENGSESVLIQHFPDEISKSQILLDLDFRSQYTEAATREFKNLPAGRGSLFSTTNDLNGL